MRKRPTIRPLTPTAAAALWLCCSAAPAWAQAEPAKLQQVEVTASKRKQVVLDVPYAVTAIGAQEIADRGVTDIKDMQGAVPTLFITQIAPGQSRIQLRGLSQGVGYGATLVGGYLDEISINMTDAQRSLDVPLVDMQRVEVLRGPQGTLYGDGSLGGVIRFITRSPRLDATEFAVEGGANQLSGGGTGWRASAVANVPIVAGSSAVRIVAGHEKLPGWVDNSATGAKDVNRAERDYVRGKFAARLGESADVSLMLMGIRTDTENQSYANPGNSYPFYIASPTVDKTHLANLVFNVGLGGGISLVSSSGWLDRQLDTVGDFTSVYRAGLPASLQALLLPKANSGGAYRQVIDMRILTQELRLASGDTGPFTWTAGTSWRKTNSRSDTYDVFTDYTGLVQGGFHGVSPTNVRQTAFFGEGTYAFTKAWSLTAGLRSFRERADFTGYKQPSSFTPPGTPNTVFDDHATFRATTPRVNLLWRYAADASAYATYSKGFRSGGFNAAVTPRTYDPEHITTVEVGNKGTLAGGRLQYEAALYYSRYRDVQAQDLAPGCTAATCRATTVNSGKASGPGFDLTLSAQLARWLTFDATVGYSDLTYDADTKERNKGDPLNYIPKTTAGLALTSRFAWTAGWPGMARVDVQHSDPVAQIIRNQNIFARSEAVTTLNARLGLEMSTWQVYLEGRNLTNFDGVVVRGTSGIPDIRATPRSLGVMAKAQF